jgi:hypothetical protein
MKVLSKRPVNAMRGIKNPLLCLQCLETAGQAEAPRYRLQFTLNGTQSRHNKDLLSSRAVTEKKASITVRH